MLKYVLILFLFISGCEDTKDPQDDIVKPTSKVNSQTNNIDNNKPICQDSSVSKCLEIIIPALWDREIERDCS